MTGIRAIAAALDGSESAQRALETAIELAKGFGASLAIVAVVPAGHRYSPERGVVTEVSVLDRRYFRELLTRSQEAAHKAGVEAVSTAVLEGSVVDQLLNFLDEQAPDLLVMGARGLSRTRRLLLGGISDAVLHHAHCSVLIVRPVVAGRRPGRPRAAAGARAPTGAGATAG